MTLSRDSAQLAIQTFSSVASSFGPTVNFVKTKSAGLGASNADGQPLVVGDQLVDHVYSFV